ncbi:MAG: transposase, partial [Acholeplasmatales bacterium]|nr:transposase [Acholeplasmatales bacterium]
RYYPSSKICNKCGYKKNDLKLSDRIFICPNCGLEIDRDYNAAINIKNCIHSCRINVSGELIPTKNGNF